MLRPRLILLTRYGVPLALLALLALSCQGPRTRQGPFAAKPGWGRSFAPEQRELEVRAVPASAVPSVPPARLGRPGWGAPFR